MTTWSAVLKPGPSDGVSSQWYAARSQRRFYAVQGLGAFAGTIEPDKVRLFAKPDQLPSRVATVLLHDQRARRRLVADAATQFHQLSIHQSAERPRVGRHAAREQRAHFVDDAACELQLDSASHTLRGQLSRHTKRQRHDVAIRDQRSRLGEVRAQRPARREVDLERPHEALAIA